MPALSTPAPIERPRIDPARPIYELNVRAFTLQQPAIPEARRGTIELIPIFAWIDERHLPPLLRNAWGYNPVVPMAIDPGLAPGGVAEPRDTVAALHDAGIGVVLDLVFNHSGESDRDGPILSRRGLDNRSYPHAPDGSLINDTGTGNTLEAGDAGAAT